MATTAMPEKTAADDLTSKRRSRADNFFNEHLRDQRGWYSRKSSTYKRYSQWLSFLIIALGATTGLVQLIPSPELVRWISASLGAAVVLAKGLERIGRFEETWLTYRKASERMKREYRLYINDAGAYFEAPDEESAYRLFVETIEAVLAEEQQIYWQSRTGNANLPSDQKNQTAGANPP